MYSKDIVNIASHCGIVAYKITAELCYVYTQPAELLL